MTPHRLARPTLALALMLVPGLAAADVPYAQLSSTETQMGGAARVVTFNACDGARRLSSLGGAVGFPEGGTYFVTAAGQVGGPGTGRVRLWLRLNGKDIENTNTEQSVREGSTSVLVTQGVFEVKPGDKLTLVFACTAPDIGLIATKAGREPAIPSMIFSAFRVGGAEFAQLSSLRTQPSGPDARLVALEQTDAARGIANRVEGLTFEADGAYYVIAAGQVGADEPGSAQLWFRRGDRQEPHTTVEQSLGRRATAVLVTQKVGRFRPGEELRLAHAGRGRSVGLVASRPRGEPAVPSLILTAFRTGEAFAQLSSLRTQPAGPGGSPIALEQDDGRDHLTNAAGVVTIPKSGTYFVIAAGQVGGSGRGTVRLWLRQNGADVENSNTEQTVAADSTAVLVCQSVLELAAGDRIQLMQGTSAPGGGMVAFPPGAGPAVPSFILSIFAID